MYSILIYSIFCVSYMILGCKYNVIFCIFSQIFQEERKKHPCSFLEACTKQIKQKTILNQKDFTR